MSSEEPDLGKLMCSIFLAGRHGWSISGYQTLYVFANGLVCATGECASARDIIRALPSPFEGTRRQRQAAIDAFHDTLRSDVEKESSLATADFLRRHPDGRIIPWESVEAARLHKGLIDARLLLSLHGGEKLRWVWWGRGDGLPGRSTPNGGFSDVKAALHEALGTRLVLR
jgi:hypothetical protein